MGDRDTVILTDAFDDLRAAVEEGRKLIESTPRFTDRPDHRAQAYVSLAEAQAMAYALAIAPRPDHPRVHGQTSWHSTIFSLGTNCGDFRYGAAVLDGRCTYRIHGRIGQLKLGLIQVQNRVMGHPDSHEIGNYDLVELAGPDGTFDLIAGPDVPEGEGVRLDPESATNFLLIRRILGAITDDPGDWIITRTAGPSPASETDPEFVAERLHAGADLLRFITRNWCVGLYDLYINAAGGKNSFAHIAGKELSTNIVGSPSTTYGLGVYDITEDEALLVEWQPPDTTYWSFQVGDVWSNATDFMHYQSDLNMNTARLDPDGVLRAVVSAEDPGVPNWMDHRGRREGVLIMRNYGARGESPAPTMRPVPLADVRKHLHSGSPTVTAEQRREALAARRAAYRTAYGE